MAGNDSHVRIVLVRPQGPLNVGSVARAMKNMGLRELALVQPSEPPTHRDARIMAVRANDILERASVHATLSDAVADCTWVIGTTRRMGREREGVMTIRQVAIEIVELIAQNKVGVVFGPETSGLSNRDLDLCQRLVVIPADREFGSLNLAQAVMVVCYEIFMALGVETSEDGRKMATTQQLEGMYIHMEEMLLRIGFLDENSPKRMMAVLRRVLGRARLNTREVQVIRGICRQINWYVGQVRTQGSERNPVENGAEEGK